MNPDDPKDSHPLRRIRLSQGDGKVLVGPPEDEKPPGFETFPLPLVSVADQAMVFAEIFYQQHRRCLGLLLLLDTARLEWTLHVPAQQASRDSACWTVPRQQWLGPHYRLAGSFQTRIIHSGEEPADCVPHLEGVHVVVKVTPGERTVYAFLRMGTSLYDFDPQRLIHSPLTEALRGSMDRIELL